MMNTGVFGQYDALALAPAVVAVLAMVRGRWVGAGIALGVTLLAKPQGLLMLPIAAFAALVAAPSGAVAFVRRLAVLGAATALTVVVGSAPWMLADGLAWLARCYRMNLFEVLPYTTLEAYNVWYLLALVAERQPAYDVLVSTATVAGLTRDAWGRVLLATALLAVTALVWRRHRRRPALATVLFAGTLALERVHLADARPRALHPLLRPLRDRGRGGGPAPSPRRRRPPRRRDHGARLDGVADRSRARQPRPAAASSASSRSASTRTGRTVP